ncbi:hypothetical protein [Candidatus Laterigemmans baculatus]|uniref:hypothetical protein n=1 Tax=Candidatus Laterigemmans baculatus TaxID=2770505 RepID=UPI0013D999BE|nr:hypothetical protein [Candidatus Laterigemmans baculatus]
MASRLFISIATLLLVCCNATFGEDLSPLSCKPNKFVFAGVTHSVREATISGVLNTPEWANFHGQPNFIKWHIDIVGTCDSPGHAPLRVSFNGLGLHVNRWQGLEGERRRWVNWQNPQTGGPYALVHRDELESVRSGDFNIFDRNGQLFRIVSSGCLDNAAEFSLDVSFTFTGVVVHGQHGEPEESLRRRLEAELPGHDLMLEKLTENVNQKPSTVSAHFAPSPENSK